MNGEHRRAVPTRTIDLVVRVGTSEREVSATVACDARLGDLVAAVGPAHAAIEHVLVAGEAVPLATPLEHLGLVDGMSIELVVAGVAHRWPRPQGDGLAHVSPGKPCLAVIGGLDAGCSVPIAVDAAGRGAAVVGTGPAVDLVVGDPTVSARHVRIDVLAGVGVTVTDLGSLNGVRIDGEPVRDRAVAPAGATISIGATDLAIRVPADDTGAAGASSRFGVFNRPPRRRPPGPVAAVRVPDPPVERTRTAFDLIALVGPILVGAVMVVVLGSLRYAAFALMGPLLLIVSQVSQRRRAAKESRSSARRFRSELASFAAQLAGAADAERDRLEHVAPDPAEIVRRAHVASTRLWERRPDHADHLVLRLGRGGRPWEVPVDRERVDAHPALVDAVAAVATLPRCPVEIDLRESPVVGIVGDRSAALALARSLLVQAAVLHGPADLTVDVCVDEASAPQWAWSSWLPHARVGVDGAAHRVRCGTAAVRAAAESLPDPSARSTGLGAGPGSAPQAVTALVVVDAPGLLVGRGAPVRRLLAASATVGVVVAVTVEDLPGCVCTVVTVDDLGDALIEYPGAGTTIPQVVIAGIGEDLARRAARALARHEDPELDEVTSSLPARVALLDLLGAGAASAEAMATSWAAATRCATPIGIGADGAVEIDLDADGPHVLVGGTTGSGKSELLRSLIAGLAAGSSPEELVFVLIDYKGGSAFDACASLPHVVGLVTDLDHQLGARALRSLEAELRLRERRLRAAGADGLDAYRRAGSPEGLLPRLVVVIDEFATLAVELPDFLGALVGIAQRGRSLGVHLVLATQRPSGVVSADIRANTNLRIALRVQDPGDSVDVIDHRDAAAIDRSTPGRAYLRVGPGAPQPVQTALATARTTGGHQAAARVVPRTAVMVEGGDAGTADPSDDGPDDLAVLVERCRATCTIAGVSPPRRPWIEPLPAMVGIDDLDESADDVSLAVALADDPDHQCRTTTWWRPDAGHLGVFGAVGSGTTNAIRVVVGAALGRWSAQRCWIYVFDHGGELDTLAAAPQVGAVVRGDERERRLRLVAFLHRCLEERRAGGAPSPDRIIVAIDGLPALLADLDGVDAIEAASQLRRVLADGPAFGISAVIGAERPAAVPTAILATVTERYLLRLADPMDAAGAGFRSNDLPVGGPGRGLHVGSRLVVQFPDAGSVPEPAAAVLHPVPDEPEADGGIEQAPPVRCLPSAVPAAALPAPHACSQSVSVPVGVGEPDLEVCRLDLRPGDHLLVAGTARSGVSTTLRLMLRSLRRADPALVVVAVADDRSPLRREVGIVDALGSLEQLGHVLDHAVEDSARRWLVVVDDAHRIGEAPGLERLEGLAHCRLVVGGRSDRLGSMFGHWTLSVRATGMGILLQPRLDADGDLLGVRLPRSTAAPMLVGRGFVVTGGDVALVQVGHLGDQDIEVARNITKP
ncbi:MAG: FtsK/SpoIIIE domain-containing protein [Acidimicrobiales bacterium]